MPRPPIIEERGLVDEVLDLRRKHSTREIAKELKKRHGLKISHVAIGNWLRAFDDKREEITKEAMRGAASAEAEVHRFAAEAQRAALPRDLEVLDGLRDWLYRVATEDGFLIQVPANVVAVSMRPGRSKGQVDAVAAADSVSSVPRLATLAERITAAKACGEVVAKRFVVTGGKPLDAGEVKKLSGNFAQAIAEQLREHHDPHATTRSERALTAPKDDRAGD